MDATPHDVPHSPAWDRVSARFSRLVYRDLAGVLTPAEAEEYARLRLALVALGVAPPAREPADDLLI
jgi:hypothetical protein